MTIKNLHEIHIKFGCFFLKPRANKTEELLSQESEEMKNLEINKQKTLSATFVLRLKGQAIHKMQT